MKTHEQLANLVKNFRSPAGWTLLWQNEALCVDGEEKVQNMLFTA
jgi:hypothetical protein